MGAFAILSETRPRRVEAYQQGRNKEDATLRQQRGERESLAGRQWR